LLDSIIHDDGLNIEVLDFTACTKYLGLQICFNNPTETELTSGINASWRKFPQFKDELTSSKYRLRDRLRLLLAAVTPTALYGCQSLTMCKDLEHQLQRTHRRMLRFILCLPRRLVTNNCNKSASSGPTASNKTDSSDTDRSSSNSTSNESADESLEAWHVWVQRATHDVEKGCLPLGLEE
jgi:hypothetical protein